MTTSPKPVEEISEIAGQAVAGVRGVLAEVQGVKTEVEDITRRGLFRLGGTALVGGAAAALVPATAKAATPIVPIVSWRAVSWKTWADAAVAAGTAYWTANSALNRVTRCREWAGPIAKAQREYEHAQRIADALKRRERALTHRIFVLAGSPGYGEVHAKVRKVYAESTTEVWNCGYHHSRLLFAAFMRLKVSGELPS